MKNTLLKFLKLLKLVFTPLAIIFLLSLGWQSRHELSALGGHVLYGWLLISLLLWVCLHLISPLFTKFLFGTYQSDICYLDGFRIHSSRLPAKYLPGGVWNTVARAVDYHNHGISRRIITASLIQENLMTALVSLSLGSSVLLVCKVIPDEYETMVNTLLMICVASLLLLPVLVTRYIVDPEVRISWRYYYLCNSTLVLYWFIVALSFVCFMKAYPDVELAFTYLVAGGTYVFSWGVGFITLFAPQGIGVSEFVTAKILVSSTSVSTLVSLIACYRLIGLLGDMLTWTTSLSMQRIFPES